ncbi:hypothetical protein TGRUB_433370 [Toxoplasma gondii RUB]|uniref:Uncharacterized protein n=1 Tax=Toxoplasma gondii RUB TaxID=935652 RepID=A0A086LLP9_TOXGO|nr:hypothetical protein TGRUB_433370 [Toxoplasma gondii RUB]
MPLCRVLQRQNNPRTSISCRCAAASPVFAEGLCKTFYARYCVSASFPRNTSVLQPPLVGTATAASFHMEGRVKLIDGCTEDSKGWSLLVLSRFLEFPSDDRVWFC